MALEQVFVDPNAFKRFRAGPLASQIDGFSDDCLSMDLQDPPFVVTFQTYHISVAIWSKRNSLIQPLLIPVTFDDLSQNISLIVTIDAQEQNIITGSLFRFIVL
jgi:hypothetical protein